MFLVPYAEMCLRRKPEDHPFIFLKNRVPKHARILYMRPSARASVFSPRGALSFSPPRGRCLTQGSAVVCLWVRPSLSNFQRSWIFGTEFENITAPQQANSKRHSLCRLGFGKSDPKQHLNSCKFQKMLSTPLGFWKIWPRAVANSKGHSICRLVLGKWLIHLSCPG